MGIWIWKKTCYTNWLGLIVTSQVFTIHDYTGTVLLEDLAVVLSESKTQTQLHSMKPDLSLNI